MLYKNITVLDIKEIKKVIGRIVVTQTRKMIVFGLILIALGIALLVNQYINQIDYSWFNIVPFVFAIIFISLPFIFKIIVVRNKTKHVVDTKFSYIFEFYENEMVIKEKKGNKIIDRITVKYLELTRVERYKDYSFVFINPSNGYIIRNDGFENEIQQDAVMTLFDYLKKKTKKKRGRMQ